MKGKVILVILAIACFCQTLSAQSAFSYQGSLKNAGAPASGNYDFEFRLWDAASGGAQVGSTVSLNSVAVTNGIFAGTLDFGDQFPGTSRFLEVRVRPTGGGAFTALTPRESIKAVPYAVTSLNSVKLGGVAASQYVTTTTGGANFIQNQNAVYQTGNFTINGQGTATILRAETQYNIGADRILSNAGNRNLFAGVGAGVNTTGNANSFFGDSAGQANTTGSGNAFFGTFAGFRNTTGGNNAFFGRDAGGFNTTAGFNAFFGSNAGLSNTTGASNTFFGADSGFNNSTAGDNAFFGSSAGGSNTTGGGNAFLGKLAGNANATGNNNTIIGNRADVSLGNLTNATAIGSQALVGASNSLVLGSINGVNGAIADTNVGIGTTTPTFKLHVIDSSNTGLRVQTNTAAGTVASFGGLGVFQIDASGIPGGRLNVSENGNVGIGTNAPLDRLYVNGIIGVVTLGAAGATTLCRNALFQISTCSSSLKYKTNIAQYSPGLAFVNKLKPISYDWKDGGMRDVGFGAEDIAKIDPRFVTYNSKGEVEGVKYDRLSVAFVNAIKEQQAEISDLRAVSSEQARKIDNQNSKLEDQQKQIERQRKELDALKKLVCSQNPTAEVCQP